MDHRDQCRHVGGVARPHPGCDIARRPRSSTRSRSPRAMPIRSRCGTPTSSARAPPREPSRRAGRRRAWPRVIPMRCAPWSSSPASPLSSPPAASAGSASPRRSTGKASCCPANFRVDAWVTPPAYTGKPPVILAGIHPGETARAADAAGEPVTVPAGGTLVGRATGKLHLDVTGSGGVTAANEATHAPSGTAEHRFKIAATGTATLRGVGDDLTWAFNATPDKPPTIALTRTRAAEPRLAASVLPRRGRLRRDRSACDLRPQG